MWMYGARSDTLMIPYKLTGLERVGDRTARALVESEGVAPVVQCVGFYCGDDLYANVVWRTISAYDYPMYVDRRAAVGDDGALEVLSLRGCQSHNTWDFGMEMICM